MDCLLKDSNKVLFDLDGLLLDTEPIYDCALEHTFKKFSGTLTPFVRQHLMGRREDELASISIDLGKMIGCDEEKFVKAMAESKGDKFSKCPMMPGAEMLLELLSERGIPFAMATSSSWDAMCTKTGLSPLPRHPGFLKDNVVDNKRCNGIFGSFIAVITGDHPDLMRGKPFGDIYRMANDLIGSDISSAIAFEDSPNGVRAAIDAGVKKVVWVPDQRSTLSYERNHPDIWCGHPKVVVLKSLCDLF